VFAQENAVPQTEFPAQEEPVSGDNANSPVEEDSTLPSPQEETTAPALEQEQATEAPAEAVAPAEEVPLLKTKFKKDNSLSVEEQLAKVRQHLIDNKLPETAIERLDAFEKQQTENPKDGIIKKIFDFITGNTKEAREADEAKKLMEREPFKVENFDGKINTAPADDYEKKFEQAKEHGNFLQKVKNFLLDGTFYNSDFDKTKEKGGIISWLFGGEKIYADASNDPDDYIAEGNEIKFSQAIQDKADELSNDPLKILNFLRNEIEYIPYYGSKKGSDGTLVELAGNDMDKSSLLVAMLRYSDIPARYRHADVKVEISTVTGLLGVDSPIRAAEILSLEDIPYIMYTQNDEPVFFVLEHTYVEAYMPYGYSRGADLNDGGESQWVAMDPTFNSYLYSQVVDAVDEMNSDGFDIEDFFDDYLNGDYATQEPLEVFQGKVEDWLIANPPADNDSYTYQEVLMRKFGANMELETVPGSLPYEISTDLNTYDYIPTSLRHTIDFTVTDTTSTEVLTYTAFISDLANREILVTYEAATPEDQTIIDGFDTIYDVVPLTLADVKPKIRVGGDIVATGTASDILGKVHKYKMEFNVPIRDIGDSVDSELAETLEKSIVTGTTDGVALNTDRIVPSILRPDEDTDSGTFMQSQKLYRTGVDYLGRLQKNHRELAGITGGDFTNRATSAAISNGVEVTYSSGQPYSFEWKGLRIDSSSLVRYFSRFGDDIYSNRKEFMALFGLQGSQDESDIFEDNFDIESVATVKGLKLVADGEFPGITLEKITEANEGDIDSLSISPGMKTVFHDAIGDGKIIYTPSDSITYGDWEGLFYIALDYDVGDGTYAIGEGLNGGYTVEQFPTGWSNFWRAHTLPGLTATINSPTNNATVKRGEDIHWSASYDSIFHDWDEEGDINTTTFPIQTITLHSGYGTSSSVDVNIVKGSNPTSVVCTTTLEGRSLPATSGTIAEEMHLPLFIDKNSGTYQTRHGGQIQYNKQDDIHSHPTTSQFLIDLGNQSSNINNPWIDPKTGKYWNMSIRYGAFAQPANSNDHEKFYVNMRWKYTDFDMPERLTEQKWYFGKKVWIKNSVTGKAVLSGILDYGPHITTNKVAGASPEAMKAIGAKTNDSLEYCWASDQDIPYGKTLTY
jgi:hypothetical protein